MARAPKTTGSLAPVEGKCGARLGKDAEGRWRYCQQKRLKGRERCKLHGGRALRGPASPAYRGRGWSKYEGLLPRGVVEQLRRSNSDMASTVEELELVDARTAQLLDDLRRNDPGVLARDSLALLGRSRATFGRGELEAAFALLEELGEKLEVQSAVVATWDEVRRNLETRAKLAAVELKYRQMLATQVMADQIDAFMRALATEVRSLTDDRQKISAFVTRVVELGRGSLRMEAAAVDGEIVEEEEQQ